MPRAVAFSGALKKKQLKEKRARLQRKQEDRQQLESAVQESQLGHRARADPAANPSDSSNGGVLKSYSKEFRSGSTPSSTPTATKENKGTGRTHGRGSGLNVAENSNHPAGQRLRSVFFRRSPADIQASRLASMKPLHFLPESDLEVSFEEVYQDVIAFPKRPHWDYSMSREQVEQNETQMFNQWIESIYNRYPTEELSYFEHNLEVWRQLWRVLEISDIIMVIVDIRHPVIHFPPSLYNYVVKDMKRKLVVVFNKVDLVAPNTLFAWKEYFKEMFPELHVASFSCYPPDPALINDSSSAALRRVVKRPRKRFYNAVGVRDVLLACKDVEVSKNDNQVDWDGLIAQYDHERISNLQETEEDENDSNDERDVKVYSRHKMENLLDRNKEDHELSARLQTSTIEDDEVTPHKDYVTIGLVGHPNVGKSSLINSIMGRTVVSTSKTPGHTKHFQTIHLTHNVRLCDSPGLVFPSILPKALQILSGMYPIAQVQEPYSVVQYLAMRINVPQILKLEPPPTYERGPFRWSAFGVCESYAIQRGFMTANSGYPDVYRAANAILRLANDGRVLLSFKPPGFFTSTKYEKLRIAAADAIEEDAASEEFSDDDGDDDDDLDTVGMMDKKKKKREKKHRRDRKKDPLGEHLGSDDFEDSDEDSDFSDDGQEEKEGDDDQLTDDHQVEDLDKSEEKPKSKFQMNTRVGGFFGLLQDGDEDEDNSVDEDEDEDSESKKPKDEKCA
ncbi:Guanine nucleotide-binding-like protein 1 [Lunasporangiospora selenospora]|uniref:Guanine nucleotide-binding protein-like 1 n=1 Tax=Lunasporangiospora selenospora TaxID=979761 RepID=A0A9P6FXS9_9FUNG|nr:Guanine nucleotide-binding-like protein 1 [Lunasporangiospora selenospora]